MRKSLARWVAGTVLALTLSHSATPAFAGQFAIRWIRDQSDTNKVFVQVSGLSERLLTQWGQANPSLSDWQGILPVYVVGPRSSETAAMFGSYSIQQNVIRFEPGFTLQKGIEYKAIFYPERWPGGVFLAEPPVAAGFKIERLKTTPTVVSEVYPTASVLPENLLKFYIQFSAPMSRGGIYSYIHLRTSSHKDVELPFLEIGEELWDTTMTRLTLFVDPGRIKRGVRPLVEMGPALEAGKRYSLIIDSAWRDGNGNRLKKSFEKHFRAGPPDRERPTIETWRIIAPKADSSDPLTILFAEPMDHALALRMIQVFDGKKLPIAGRNRLTDHERRWTFIPEKPWTRQRYELSVATTLEDLAGNSIAKLFDVDVFEPQAKTADPTVTIPLEIK